MQTRSSNPKRSLRPNEVESFSTKLATTFGKDLDRLLTAVYIGSSGVRMCCFYHSAARAIIPEYQNPLLLKQILDSKDNSYPNNQEKFIETFRNDLSDWFTLPAINPVTNQEYTYEEAVKFINSHVSMLRFIIKSVALSRELDSYDDFTEYPDYLSILRDKPFNKNIMVNYILDALQNQQLRDEALSFIAHECAFNDKIVTEKELFNILINNSPNDRFVPSFTQNRVRTVFNINTLLRSQQSLIEEVKLDMTPAQSAKKVPIIIQHIKSSFQNTLNPRDLLQNIIAMYRKTISGISRKTEAAFENYVIQYYTIHQFLKQNIRDLRTRNYGKFVDNSPDILSVQDRSSAIALLERSINKRTNLLFTLDEIQEVLKTDPRTFKDDNGDDLVMDTDARLRQLNSNFFMSGGGRAILSYPALWASGVTMNKIIENVSYRSRCDAGEEDVLPFFQDMLNINFILCKVYEDHLHVEKVYSNYSDDRPYILVNRHTGNEGGHFETIGIVETGEKSIKTLFEPYHPFITSLLAYDQEFVTLKNFKLIYDKFIGKNNSAKSEENLERFKDYESRKLMGETKEYEIEPDIGWTEIIIPQKIDRAKEIQKIMENFTIDYNQAEEYYRMQNT